MMVWALTRVSHLPVCWEWSDRPMTGFIRRRRYLPPHPEERALARVSKDGGLLGRARGHPSRRALKGAPQDEVRSFLRRRKRGCREDARRSAEVQP